MVLEIGCGIFVERREFYLRRLKVVENDVKSFMSEWNVEWEWMVVEWMVFIHEWMRMNGSIFEDRCRNVEREVKREIE